MYRTKSLYLCLLMALLPTNHTPAQANGKKEAPKDLEIWCADSNTSRTWLLDETFDRNAEILFAANKITNDPRYFDRTFLWKTKEVRNLLQAEGAKRQQLTLNDEDETVFNITILDRKSDTLLVLGPGYPVPRERLAPFAKIFPNYDLLLLDYRGQGIDHQLGWGALLPWRWKGAFTYWLFGTDFNTTCLGMREEAEVITAVNYAKKQKMYAHVYGLGSCFSSYLFVKAAACKPNLFDKLILDNNWLNLCDVIKRGAADPDMILCGASPLPWITHSQAFQELIITLIEWIVWINLKESKQLIDYLPSLTCPVMFIQGREDRYCPWPIFQTIWQTTPTPKVSVITHNAHSRNHLWQKGAYAKLSHWFLENSNAELMELLDQVGPRETKAL